MLEHLVEFTAWPILTGILVGYVANHSLFYTYEVKTGEKQTFSIQPVSIIILDKQYENNEVKLIKDGE